MYGIVWKPPYESSLHLLSPPFRRHKVHHLQTWAEELRQLQQLTEKQVRDCDFGVSSSSWGIPLTAGFQLHGSHLKMEEKNRAN